MDSIYDLAVVGGGASGMAAAVSAGLLGDHVALLEASPRLGRKLLASGNGRCNLMNAGDYRYYGDASFAASVLSHAGSEDIRSLMYRLGVILTEGDDEGRVYPVTGQAATVTDALKNGLRMVSAHVETGAPVTQCVYKQDGFHIFRNGSVLRSKRLLVSTGGPAAPRLGGTDSGFRILSSFGHRIVPAHPALAPLITDRKSISGLSGMRVRCTVSLLGNSDQMIHREKGEVLFTDYGVSGICVMQCAGFVPDSMCTLALDLVSHIFPGKADLVLELRNRRSRFAAFPPETLLNGILLPKLSYAVLKQAGIPLRGEKTGDLTDGMLDSIAAALMCYRLSVQKTRGMEYAQVSSGGADCSQFSDSNMESSLIPGLHASGEVLNVDGDCGGYNLMFAFASGILAGRNGRSPKGEY